MKKLKIVEVEWEDSCSDSEWKCSLDTKEHTVSSCKSAGYLFSKNKKQVSIIQSISDHGNVADHLAIPRKCVKNIRELK